MSFIPVCNLFKIHEVISLQALTMKSVTFHPLAEQELIDAVSYYEEQEAGLGLEYLGEVEHAVNFLMRYPEAGAKITGAIRRLTLPKFP
jgi:toxin ParE1/3/4